MKIGPPRAYRIATALLVVLVMAAGGCKKQGSEQGGGGGEPINLNALGEIENYKEILRKDPNNLQANIKIGNLYFDTRQDLQAIEHYRKALDLDPRNANVRTDMAVAYRRSGKPDQAVEELRKAISMDPKHAQARYNLGVILIHDKNDLDGGIRAWEALLENVPGYPYRDQLRAEITRMRTMMESARPKSK